MLTLGGSAFKPYYRPSSSTLADGPTDKITPLSILTDLLAGGIVMPVELQTELATAAASLQRMSSADGANGIGGQTASVPLAEVATAVGKAKRKRTTFTASQATYLEKEYDSDQYMPRSRRIAVAESLQLSENQIKTWFQNRRAKDKKIRTISTACSSSTARLPSSSPLISPVPSAASSSSSSPPLSVPILSQTQADPIPSLIELLALGKTDLMPLSQMMSNIKPVQSPLVSLQ